MRTNHILAFFAFFVGLLFPSLAVGQEGGSLLPATTYVVVAGSSEFPLAPGLPGAEGATEDCAAIAAHLYAQGFPERQVLTACGPELVRARFTANLQEFARRVRSGGMLLIVWIGHGGTDPTTGQKILAFANGSFDLFVTEGSKISGSAYARDGVSMELLYVLARQNVPTNARVAFVLDVARGGTYEANGGTLVLEGPSAKDFMSTPGVLAVSPVPGTPVPAGLTRDTVTGCVVPPPGATSLTARQFLDCYTEGITRARIPIDLAGEWREHDTLIVFPSAPLEATKPPTVKIALLVGGGLLAIGGATTSAITFAQAQSLGEEIESGKLGAAGDPTLTAAVERYNTLRRTLPAWEAVAVVGGACVGIGFAISL